jgi:hypothetical protein
LFTVWPFGEIRLPDSVLVQHFTRELFEIFDETFEHVRGIYLDPGTSLFETLATISAAEASRPVSIRCASLAAQVAHVRFYIDTLSTYMRGENPGKVDWGEIWRTVEAVTPEQWAESQRQLKTSYQALRELMTTFTTWEGENEIAGALAVLAHTAYHLGEIRQALCTIQPTPPAT